MRKSVPIMKRFPEMKVFGNEGLANETSVNATEPDKVHGLDPAQTGIAPRSRNKTYGYNIYCRELKTQKKMYSFSRQRDVQIQHLLLGYCCYLPNICIQA